MLAALVFLAAMTVVMALYGFQKMATQKEEALRQRVEAITVDEPISSRPGQAKPKGFDVSTLVSRFAGPEFIKKQGDLLAGADLALRPNEFVSVRIILAVVFAFGGILMTDRPIAGLLLAVMGYKAPVFYVRRRISSRRSKFDMQLPDALQLITNSLRAGFSFPKALEVAAQNTPPPMSKDLGIVIRENSIGMGIDQALRNMSGRVQSPDFDIVVSAFLIQREVGGNLAVVMEKVADTVRQRLRLRGELQVLTAQGRISGYVVGLLPVAVFFILLLVSPGYFDPMFHDVKGWIMLGGGIGMQVFGTFVIQKIMSIKM